MFTCRKNIYDNLPQSVVEELMNIPTHEVTNTGTKVTASEALAIILASSVVGVITAAVLFN